MAGHIKQLDLGGTGRPTRRIAGGSGRDAGLPAGFAILEPASLLPPLVSGICPVPTIPASKIAPGFGPMVRPTVRAVR
jgi:hypothetical protein